MEAVATVKEPGRARWLNERRKGIGGTDAAAILGFSPYATEHDVWLAKKGLAPEKRETEAMWWGRELEELVARRYSEVTGFKLLNPESPAGEKYLVYHPEHPELIGSPDRLVVGQDLGLEVKTASAFNADDFGRPGTDEVPKSHLIQCAHYMAITGFRRWDVAALIGGSDFRIYHINADAAVESAMIERLTEWWRRRIIEGEPPAVDGSESSERFLDARFPLHKAERLSADERANQIARELMASAEAEEQAAGQITFWTAKLKELIGDAEGMDGDGWRATWKSARGRTYTDWQAVARDIHLAYLAECDRARARSIEEFVASHTEVGSGSRPWRFTTRGKERG